MQVHPAQSQVACSHVDDLTLGSSRYLHLSNGIRPRAFVIRDDVTVGPCGRHIVLDAVDVAEHHERLAVQTFGNLTLLTQPLNSSVSNGPFEDQIEGEKTVVGKRTKFLESLLLLNAYFQHKTVAKWDDEEISKRGQHLLGKAMKVWSRP